ncbi:MAG: MFS transporter, partial [Bacteroidales bacterium]|nr:MFS transporter [Bacteroidales bacterium]
AGEGFQFAGQAFLIWMPAALREGLGMTATRAAFDSSFYPQLASVAGVLIGARIADRYVLRNDRARLWVQTAGFLLGAPFFYMVGAATTEVAVCVAMVGYGFFKGFYDSNIFASIYDEIDGRYRAMATSFILMFSLIIASMSPYMLGLLKPAIGLGGGMKLMALVYMLSSVPVIGAILVKRSRLRQS